MAIKKISANLLGGNAVLAANIAGGAISAADIADNSITAAKISASTSPTFGGLTTTGDINITGTVTSDGLTVDGNILAGTSTVPTGLGASNTKLILSNDSDSPEVVVYRNTNLIGAGDKVGAYLFGNDDNNATEDHFAGIWAKSSGTGGQMDIYFAGGRDNYENDTSQMILTYDGNVGIGTSSPDNTLMVQGASTTGVSSTGNVALFEGPSGTNGLKIFIDDTENAAGLQTIAADDLLLNPHGGSVGIGTDSPATQFHLVNADDAVARIESSGSEATDDARLEIKTTNGTFTIQNDRSLGTSGALTFAGNTSDNLVIDHNSGKVGIGTASPEAILEVESANATGDQVRFGTSSNNSAGNFKLSLQTNSANRVEFLATRKSSTGGSLDIYTRAVGGTLTNALTIDESQNVGIGTDNPSGKLTVNVTSNGQILQLALSGTEIGNLGTVGNDMYVGTGDTTLRFHDSGNDIRPASNTGSAIDNTIDLGHAGASFRDLYLGSGIYLTGTTSANYLDDYEEGTWTPSINLPNATVSSYGKYTKIGNLVYIAGAFGWSGKSGTANVVISGLPFSGANNSDTQARPSAFPEGDLVNMGTIVDNYGHFRLATSQMQGVIMSGGNTAYMSSNNFSSSGEFNFSVVYTTT